MKCIYRRYFGSIYCFDSTCGAYGQMLWL